MTISDFLFKVFSKQSEKSYLVELQSLVKEFQSKDREIRRRTAFEGLKAFRGLDPRINEIIDEEGNILERFGSVTEKAADHHFSERDKLVSYFKSVKGTLSEIMGELDEIRKKPKKQIERINYDALSNPADLEKATNLLERNIEMQEIEGREAQMKMLIGRSKRYLNDAEYFTTLLTKHAITLEMLSAAISGDAQHFKVIMPVYSRLAETYHTYKNIRTLYSTMRNSTSTISAHVEGSYKLIKGSGNDMLLPTANIRSIETLLLTEGRTGEKLETGKLRVEERSKVFKRKYFRE